MSPSELLRTRAEALFASALQPSEDPTPEQIRQAVLDGVSRHRVAGCAALVAQEYGDHPVDAVDRMRWAVAAVRAAYQLVGPSA